MTQQNKNNSHFIAVLKKQPNLTQNHNLNFHSKEKTFF